MKLFLSAIILTIPWLFGLFFIGALLGIWLHINPYIAASLVMGVGIFGLVFITARLTK